MSEESDKEKELRKFYPASRENPAIYVNNFYVTGSPQIIRIAFGESAQDPVGIKYRVTVAMPLEDARELVQILSEMIEEFDDEAVAEKPEN